MKRYRIEKNWTEIKAIEDHLREKYKDPEAGFHPSIFQFCDKMFMVTAQYRKPKGKGRFTQKRFDVLILAKFCPFTGAPLFEEGPEDRDEDYRLSATEFLYECNDLISKFLVYSERLFFHSHGSNARNLEKHNENLTRFARLQNEIEQRLKLIGP